MHKKIYPYFAWFYVNVPKGYNSNGIEIQMTETENKSWILIGRWMNCILTQLQPSLCRWTWPHFLTILFHFESISILITFDLRIDLLWSVTFYHKHCIMHLKSYIINSKETYLLQLIHEDWVQMSFRRHFVMRATAKCCGSLFESDEAFEHPG